MAISTLDGVAAGTRQFSPFLKAATATTVVGRPLSLWQVAGVPGPGSFNGTLAGATLSSADAGCLTRGNPSSGNSYLHTLAGINAQNPGLLLLVDRLWNNGGFTITSTGAQTVSSVTWPTRCPTSATDDTPATTGHGVLLGMEISTVVGAAAPTITVSYTNSVGTASRTGTATGASAAVAQSFFPIGLAAGDLGVRSVQTVTLSVSWVSGVMNLVAYRVLASLAIGSTQIQQLGPLTGGLPRIYDSSCLSLLWLPSTAASSAFQGGIVETQG